MITLPSGRRIGPGEPPFIVAEIGSNWRTLDDCLHSIAMAKACGADAVKFQAFTYESLYGPVESTISHQKELWTDNGEPKVVTVCTSSRDALADSCLPLGWLSNLKAKADACGIEFMCSAFSPELVAAVDPYVNIHKVASAEMTHVRILEAVRKTGKPVILSTGASGERDIEHALEVLKGVPVVLMYCVAAYPARTVDLRNISHMRVRFNLPVGYSDHTTDALEIPRLAVEREGACVLEKHVNFEGVDGPDAPHSLTTDEFKLYCKAARGADLPIQARSGAENPMVIRHNRRLIATRDVSVGETLEEGKNFGIYRSLKDDTHALSPFMIVRVHGQSAKRAIKAGDGIGPGDF